MNFLLLFDTKVFHLITQLRELYPFFIKFSAFIANKLIYILPLHLIYMWFQNNKEIRRRALIIFFAVCFALLLAFLVGLFFPRDRPFVAGISPAFLYHKPNTSFPSDHALIFSAYLYCLYQFRYFKIFIIALLFAILTCLARIIVGIHYPSDIIGGVMLGILAGFVMEKYFSFMIPDFLLNIPKLKNNRLSGV